jgi:hypothetical protein
MACESQFPASISPLCVLQLIGKTRNGINTEIVKEWVWVAGCLMETFTPNTLPPTSEIQETNSLQESLGQLEVLCIDRKNFEDTPLLYADKAGFDWAILVPIALKILDMLLKKYLQPTLPVPPAPPAKS